MLDSQNRYLIFRVVLNCKFIDIKIIYKIIKYKANYLYSIGDNAVIN